MSGFDQRVFEIMRVGTDLINYRDLSHDIRTDSIERRFHGERKLLRLRVLKKKFDLENVFTKKFL